MFADWADDVYLDPILLMFIYFQQISKERDFDGETEREAPTYYRREAEVQVITWVFFIYYI